MQMQTLLCVDDDESSLNLIRQILKARPNIKVLTSLDSEQALEMTRIINLDLIIMDINQPKMDGYAVLNRLRANEDTRHIPVIACSGHAAAEDIARGLAAGFLRYIVKPFKIAEFLETIDGVLLQNNKP